MVADVSGFDTTVGRKGGFPWGKIAGAGVLALAIIIGIGFSMTSCTQESKKTTTTKKETTSQTTESASAASAASAPAPAASQILPLPGGAPIPGVIKEEKETVVSACPSAEDMKKAVREACEPKKVAEPAPAPKAKNSGKGKGGGTTKAKAAPDNSGRLLVIHCEKGVISSEKTPEPGTSRVFVGNCNPPPQPAPLTRLVDVDLRAPAVAATATASASASASVATPSVTGGLQQPNEKLGTIWLWHDPYATAAAPKPCVIASGDGRGLPPYCSGFRVDPPHADETKPKWLVRVGGGHRPTDTGLYTKKD